MKKILYILAVTFLALTTSCNNDFAYPPLIMGDIKGEGTADDPYNVTKAVRVAAANGETSDIFVFTAGYVVSGSIDTSYGNATWDLCDNPDGSSQTLIAYRVKDFDNKKFTNADKVKVGDYVVLYAPLINFRGNTPETGTGGYIYSINGVVGSTIVPQEPTVTVEPKGSGTEKDPYNVTKAIEVAKANGETSETFVYLEGYVVSGSIDLTYGNATWDICDNADGSSAKIIAYRVKDFKGEKFNNADKVKPGDKVVIYAPLINYKGNTPETGSGGYLFSLNGKTE